MKLIDLTGQKIGRWTVLERRPTKVSSSGRTRVRWNCICECKTKKSVDGAELRSGRSLSCGCYAREKAAERQKKFNRYELHESFGIGYTNKNEPFYFDIEDYEKIKNYCWFKNNTGYIYAKVPGTKKHVLMHRLILDNVEMIDHISGNKTDNRKNNVRPTNNSLNQMNKKNSKKQQVRMSWCHLV